MPGLAGFVSGNIDDKQLLERMANSIKHKPWQQIEEYSELPFNVARVHLGIFNPEPQPVFNEDKTLGIFMYGKIYGYEQQRKELETRHKFVSSSDAEFCLHAYEEYGKKFVKRLNLNGAFILIICDLRRKELVIINDRYGSRPLHYININHRLLFASEAKAILQDGALKKELNDEAVADYFSFGEIYGNKTFFKGIEVLPPASIFIYDGQSISIERYWDFNYEPDYRVSEDEWADQVVKAFREAVKIQTKDNLRYGIALSGGLDSRSVLGAIDKERREGLITFTFGLPGCDEAKIAEVISRIAGAKHIFIPISPNEVLSPYPEQVVYLTEGMFPIHTSHQLFAFEKMKPYIDVFLNGAMIGELLGSSQLTIPLQKQVFRAKNDAELVEILNKRRRIFSDNALAELLAADYYHRIKEIPLQSVKSSLPQGAGHPANKYDYVITQNYIRRSMFMAGCYIAQNMVENVMSVYHNGIIDAILKIPPELRANYHIRRRFLKKLAPDLARAPYNYTMIRADAPLILWKPALIYSQYAKQVLERLIWRVSREKIYLANKRDYAPVYEWLRVNQNWRKFARDTLLANDTCLKDFCQQEYIQTLIAEHETGKANHFHKINVLLTLELFLRMFFAGHF